MDHPLGEDTSVMSDEQIQEKISMLTKKYFQTRNPEAKSQINLMLDMYKLESRDRLLKKWHTKTFYRIQINLISKSNKLEKGNTSTPAAMKFL